jgi:hypothetical protein
MSLKTPFTQPVYPNTTDLGGDLATSRGTDPLTDTSGSSALQTPFDKPIDPSLDGQETPNSVSGLPAQPNRFQPSETPPDPPSLEDRNPGTIDKR